MPIRAGGPRDGRIDRPISRAKLTPPTLDHEIVERSGVERAWRTATDGQIVAFTAGAGWGKTRAVAERMRSSQRPYAWVTLDADDNDLDRFWTYLCSSIEQATNMEGLLDRVTASHSRGVDAFVAALDDVGPIDIVLDDVHHLRDPHVVEQLARTLNHVPATSRFVIAGRRLPRVGISRLLGQGRLVRCSASDLALSVGETQRLIDRAIPDATDLGVPLWKFTQGWPIGVRLAIRSALDTGDPAHHLAQLEAIPDDMGEFLLEEVFEHLDPTTRRFMTETSILDRLTPSACAAVTGRPDADARLAELARAHCFIDEVATPEREFQYHDMFRDFAQRQLERSGTDVAELRRRAGHEAESRGDLNAAVLHYLRAGDPERAARHLGPNIVDFLIVGRLGELAKWWDAIPSELLPARQHQLGTLFIYALTHQDDRFRRLAERIREHMDIDSLGRTLQSDVDTIEAFHMLHRGRVEQALRLSTAATTGTNEDAERPHTNFLAWLTRTRAELLVGHIETAAQLHRAELARAVVHRYHESSYLVIGAWIALGQGRADAALEFARSSHRAPAIGDHWGFPIEAHLAHGAALHALGHRTGARRRYEDALFHAQIQKERMIELRALLCLTRLHSESGDADTAAALATRARRIHRTDRMSPLLLEPLGANGLAWRTTTPALTPREAEVLKLLPTRLTRSGIAEHLHVSPHTVHHHMKSIYRKLKASDRDEAIRLAHHHRLIDVAD